MTLPVAGQARIAEPIVTAGAVSKSTIAFGLFLASIEFGGGNCITIGLCTRFFAAALATEITYLTFVQYGTTAVADVIRL